MNVTVDIHPVFAILGFVIAAYVFLRLGDED